MSNAKEKKYAKRMRNQPSNVSLSSDIGTEQGHRPRHNERQENFQQHRDSHPGPSGQHQRHPYQSHGTHFHGRGGKGRGAPSEVPLVPKYITATMFAQARAAEINAMVKAVSQKSSNTLVFQSLPRHMRRRAMGHDIKRLPRRLREVAKKEMEKSAHLKKEVSKNKCRKARRRHGNLQLEFNRRQRKNIWLETHIWHAKRFHMVKKWGYCLGHRPTMKSYRACYRAMSSNCLLQDLSYYCCLQLMGEEAALLNALSRLTSTETGPSFAAALCLSGKRQGSLVLYRADKYPKEALGSVTFLWKPACVPDSPSEKRQLWIWCHPTLKQDILRELRQVCQCEEAPDIAVCKPEPVIAPQPAKPQTTPKTTAKKRKRKDQEGEQAVPVKRIIGDGTRDSLDPYYWTSKHTAIRISDLTMEFVRYRLTGPLSHSVLTEALRSAPLHKETESDAGPHTWWADYCSNPENVRLHTLQESMFQLLQVGSPAEFPPGTILGLTVGDPRLNLPKQKTKAVPSVEKYEDRDQVKSIKLNGFPLECAQSFIWASDICSKVTENKVSEQEINRMRSELLVPGSRLDLGNSESKIPVLLIQHPGKRTGTDRPGWGSGWDICLPKGWGMAFWIPFIYRGVRVGGLQQALQHSQYMGIPDAPGDFPDCPAGVQSAKETEDSLLEAYKRRPPAKRANFIKHGVLAPFRCPWEQLTAEWDQRAGTVTKVPAAEKEEETTMDTNQEGEVPQGTVTEAQEDVRMEPGSQGTMGNELDMEKAGGAGVCVLRNKRILKELCTLCSLCNQRGPRSKQIPSPAPHGPSDMLLQVLHTFPRSLVWVRLTMLTKGTPELHAMICIPSEQDLVQLATDKSFAGPQEPKHGDPIKKKVLKHQKETKKKKAKAKMEKEAPQQKEEMSRDDDSDQLTLGLWPNPLPPVISHCCRTLLGFVTHGDFSMAAGCGESLGFVSLTGLIDMLSGHPVNRTGFVLVRNPSSLQYRFAKIMVAA
ncbi:ribonucleases P/MRP protein subunit POP1 isoform X2 [Xenopus tropicalis]|uniref:Ribonucleases P/MRP protein subunit POP1 isoform X2 n=1 Tax=Xenopus tropicalis TaxID=8364 RepID=A0A8J0R005_XENTR|nr:ribonucleases P/MRP protein subunit POP1 isoform X2 [Xenopus tropicalis]|eukprot:XP_004915183.1 PREDICTED: ribonucleases P/MRP protein subunit POP1 isoform X2 [Xenopus tropicalis]